MIRQIIRISEFETKYYLNRNRKKFPLQNSSEIIPNCIFGKMVEEPSRELTKPYQYQEAWKTASSCQECIKYSIQKKKHGAKDPLDVHDEHSKSTYPDQSHPEGKPWRQYWFWQTIKEGSENGEMSEVTPNAILMAYQMYSIAVQQTISSIYGINKKKP